MAIETFFHDFRESQHGVISTTGTLASGGNRQIDVNTASGAVVVTLPPAAENAWSFLSFRKIGGGSNTFTLAGVTGSGIATNGGLQTMESDNERCVVMSDGVQWHTLSQTLTN